MNPVDHTLQLEHALRLRLMARVQRSRAHEAQFDTVRREQGAWHAEAEGVRSRRLAQTEVARSLVVELAPQATLPAWPGFRQAELVLLDGQASLGTIAFDSGEAACVAHGEGPRLQAGTDGARLYLRLSAPAVPPREPLHFSALHGDEGWLDFCPGVRIRPLWDGGERRSLLVRMQPGALVGQHPHALEEECLMVAGEAFVGDTLLRCGDYQLAPQASEHGAVTTDVGAVFFVHGALDPAAYA